MTNPTPVAWMDRRAEILYLWEGPYNANCKPLYTEAQLNQARADALWEAAELLGQMVVSGEASISEVIVGIHTLREMAKP